MPAADSSMKKGIGGSAEPPILQTSCLLHAQEARAHAMLRPGAQGDAEAPERAAPAPAVCDVAVEPAHELQRGHACRGAPLLAFELGRPVTRPQAGRSQGAALHSEQRVGQEASNLQPVMANTFACVLEIAK